ncbi:unnamed protein product [Dovyalis caffra]|uniref:Uncharacterized protein n=1 Tax=Dovyalis caffra TaxID=77055 RepID=A0AAV1SNQ4_9ROSI|nr:unnamed protein product [Dovyalis caffra]
MVGWLLLIKVLAVPKRLKVLGHGYIGGVRKETCGITGKLPKLDSTREQESRFDILDNTEDLLTGHKLDLASKSIKLADVSIYPSQAELAFRKAHNDQQKSEALTKGLIQGAEGSWFLRVGVKDVGRGTWRWMQLVV